MPRIVCQLEPLLIFTAPFIVQWPYFQAGHVWDDLRHLGLLGELSLGQLSWAAFLARFHNEHFILLWKLWYFFTWRVAGLDPLLWHVCVACMQGVSAVALYVVVRSYTNNRTISLLAGLLWGGATIGGFDSPLLWIAASHLAMGVMWMLLGMVCVTKFHSPHSLIWSMCMALCMACSMMSMGALTVLSPILLLQLFWLEKPTDNKGPWRYWVGGWACVFMALSVYQFSIFVQIRTLVPSDSSVATSQKVLAGALGAHLVGTIRMLTGSLWKEQTAFALAALVGVLLIVMLVRSRNSSLLRVAALFWLMSLSYTLLVAFARAEFDTIRFATFGRFAYLPTLATSVAIAGAAGLLVERLSKRSRRVGFATMIVIIAAYLSLQCRLALLSQKEFAEVNRVPLKVLADNRAMLKEVLSSSSTEKIHTIPNLYVENTPTTQSLDVFAAYAAPRQSSEVEIQPVADCTKEELDRFRKVLVTASNESKLLWEEVLSTMIGYEKFLARLSQRADQESQRVRIPDVMVPFPLDKKPSLSQLLGVLYGNSTPPVNVVPLRYIRVDDLRLLHEVASGQQGPVADSFVKLSQELAQKISAHRSR